MLGNSKDSVLFHMPFISQECIYLTVYMFKPPYSSGSGKTTYWEDNKAYAAILEKRVVSQNT